MDYAAILVYRDESGGIGSYEFGAIMPVASVFSDTPINEVIASAQTSDAPVAVVPSQEGEEWDFSWVYDQIAAKYQGIRMHADIDIREK